MHLTLWFSALFEVTPSLLCRGKGEVRGGWTGLVFEWTLSGVGCPGHRRAFSGLSVVTSKKVCGHGPRSPGGQNHLLGSRETAVDTAFEVACHSAFALHQEGQTSPLPRPLTQCRRVPPPGRSPEMIMPGGSTD